ncbi:MAG: L-serine ammonia-lyase [Sediminibacterium sp.]|nr:L-serine ammonia-lyase [Sediminibacterium sp.]
MDSISVFEIIKVGIGPSSSHTMGPWIAGKKFIQYISKHTPNITDIIEIKTYLFGSLAKTGIGHGTDIALVMGLTNEDYTTINTTTIPAKIEQIKITKLLKIGANYAIHFDYNNDIIFEWNTILPYHPNGIRFITLLKNGQQIIKEYFSVGGGFVVSLNEDTENNIKITTPYPCHNAASILQNCNQLNLSISQLVLLNETAWRPANQTKLNALIIWEEIKQCIYRGVHTEGILPGGLNVNRRAFSMNKQLLKEKTYSNINEWLNLIKTGVQDFNAVNKWVSVFALAVNEENASFGRIITAPTNGASGVIPAVLMYAYCFTSNFTEEQVVQFILTAGEIGTLYKKGATISAAMGGCQAEIGVSSSMAAAGLTEALGGSKEQVLQAAEIAMEHHLGLTCDPIGGLVQIPCIERNAMGAIKAITASNLSFESDVNLAFVSLDNVIKTMWQTALDMNSKYKETSEAGLAKISVNNPAC